MDLKDAPNAKKVELECWELLAGKDSSMKKNDDSVWELQVKRPLPGFYTYRFKVDGIPTLDYKNIRTFHTVNQLLIPGEGVDYLTMFDVPLGILHRHIYSSRSVGTERPVHVYTPPSFRTESNQTYPVLSRIYSRVRKTHKCS